MKEVTAKAYKKSIIRVIMILFVIAGSVVFTACGANGKSYIMEVLPLNFYACEDYSITEEAFVFHNFLELIAFVKQEKFQLSDDKFSQKSYYDFRHKSLNYDNQYFEKKDLIILFKYVDSINLRTTFINNIFEREDSLIIEYKKEKPSLHSQPGFTSRLYFIEIEKVSSEINNVITER